MTNAEQINDKIDCCLKFCFDEQPLRHVIVGLSGAVILLIITTLVMRKRRTLRKKRVKTQIVNQAEERKRRQQIPCDDFVSPRNNGNGLQPTSSEDQSGRSFEDGKSQKLKGNNSTDEYEM